MDSTPPAIIKYVEKPGIADEVGIEPGDILLTINGKRIEDIFEYRLICAEDFLLMKIQKADGEVWEIEVEKDEGEDLGIEFVNPLIAREKNCRNKCIFCFIDQLPEGMRESLYFKDDDVMLSFLTGNYVTLTNITDDELDKIIKYRLSPINVSVHTTEPELRCNMLNNRFAGNIVERINKITGSRLKVNAQIVMCKGWNDGDRLRETILTLAGMYPGIESLSVVPVGLTSYRDGLVELEKMDKFTSLETISIIENVQKKMIDKYDNAFVFPADEFYLTAEKDIPPYEMYYGFPQLENGVGMLALMKKEIIDACNDYYETQPVDSAEKIIITGIAAENFINDMLCYVKKRFSSINAHVMAITNDFFGKDITVAGLITGRDILKNLSGKAKGKIIAVPDNMLKSEEPLFLDDITVKELSERLGTVVTPVENTGAGLVRFLLTGRGM